MAWKSSEHHTEEQRIYLYKLEDLRIVRLESVKDTLQWVLTDRGNTLVKQHELLGRLWKENKIKEFYEEILRLELIKHG